MQNIYRDENINKHMEKIETLLTAISEKKSSQLGVQEIMKRDELITYDEAIRIGMRETANDALIQVKALAVGFDRVAAMVNQMFDEMETSSKLPIRKDFSKQSDLYRNRLKVLTNFVRIADEFNPSKATGFAHAK